MAGTSPTRRSSRARATQSQSHNTSSASSASGRAERSTRAFTKTGSPQKSTGSGSLSSEPPEDPAPVTNDDTILRRRSTRGKEDERERQPKVELPDMAVASDEAQDDDEAVRCICGHDEYPGPPPFDEDSKHGLKDAIDHERIFAIEVTDDMAGFFVQCEICNTWQHGACVGFAEETNPDDVQYFCEKCRKDLHKIYTASNGQKYSIYLPIHRSSRAASRATPTIKDGAQSPKSGTAKSSRSAAATHTSKRRSTMNSRDAAYDEEEQLRRAIEASKEDAIPEAADPPPRRPKRGRDDSEEKVEGVKRQRTNSKSPSPKIERPQSVPPEESEDESAIRNGSSKKTRNAARNQREKAEREERREEQERKRAEAATKRKGRAERRQADDSDPSEEIPLAARAAANRATESAQPPEPPLSSQPPPDTPPAAPAPTTTHKKKATGQKKKGRNQYTKDRDNRDHGASPARSSSRDVTKNGDENSTSHTKSSAHESTGKQSKSKGGMNSRITMTDMKRRAHNILEYITRTQVELASDPLSEPVAGSQQNNSAGDGSASAASPVKVNGDKSKKPDEVAASPSGPTSNGTNNTNAPLKEFKEMSCIEMMDVLARDLVKWQQEFVA
ncbi:Histone deacetylase complex subunit [Parahypoxylon ruwenzoriense]